MAGYSKIFVIGEEGGFMGADGVNPILFQILVGDSDRRWLEVHYFDTTIESIGKIRSIISGGPDVSGSFEDDVLDAVIAFCPAYFDKCPSLPIVKEKLRDAVQLDFDHDPDSIPREWQELRREAKQFFPAVKMWEADLKPVRSGSINP